MEYEEAITFLHNLGKFGVSLGLDRTLALLDATGLPHLKLKAVHVAGTNGKGSVAAMTASVLRAAGFRVGLYTSPHLSSYTERIRVDGRPMPRRRLAELVTTLRPHFERMASQSSLGAPTEFEMGTVMAFLYFAEERVDYAVIEVGLGGRLDATNVITPLVSVITHVDLDHRERLGGTIEEIAGEKAGIIKRGVPVVVGVQHPPALEVIKRAAAERAAPALVVGEDVHCERTSCNEEGQRFRAWVRGRDFGEFEIPLLGQHQVENAACVVGVAQVLGGIGVHLTREAVKRGFKLVEWPGRLEVLQRRPLVMVDGAHNLDGVRRLALAVPEVTGGRRVTAVVGISRDKQVEDMVREVAGFASQVIATTASSSRLGAVDPRSIVSLALRAGCPGLVRENAVEAVDEGLKCAGHDGVLLVCGSLYLVGEVRNHLLSIAGTLPMTRRIVVFTGAYGSGKTEVSLNFASLKRRDGARVVVVDLDIVNPYFRSREAAREMESRGVEVISSAPGFEAADLPALAPAILRAFHDETATIVFDVGGDPVGARALARYSAHFEGAGYDMFFVVNANRPFTRDVEGAEDMLESIEEASGLTFTGIVSNTHMGDETTPRDVLRGTRLAHELAARRNLPVVFACATPDVLAKLDGGIRNTRVVPIELHMRPPWARDSECGRTREECARTWE
ncbi:MAG: Mur ligase family protein [Firmicutes bacterium]|nr:Mur ligase family protein [Bacillota bacterium]MDH7494949.1 Mur ligase family protein [Bacillota bacterium]